MVVRQKPPQHQDNEQSIDEVRARIRKTVAFVESVRQDQYTGAAAQRNVVVPRGLPATVLRAHRTHTAKCRSRMAIFPCHGGLRDPPPQRGRYRQNGFPRSDKLHEPLIVPAPSSFCLAKLAGSSVEQERSALKAYSTLIDHFQSLAPLNPGRTSIVCGTDLAFPLFDRREKERAMDRRLFVLAVGMFALGTYSFVVAAALPGNILIHLA